MLVLNQTLIADTALPMLSERGECLGTKLGLLAGRRRRVHARGRLAGLGICLVFAESVTGILENTGAPIVGALVVDGFKG